MKRISLVAIALLLLAGGCRKDEGVSRDEVLQTLDVLEHKLEWLNYQVGLETWELYTTGQSDSLEFYRGLTNYVISDPETFAVVRQGKPLVSDKEDVRRVELLESDLLLAQVESSLPVTKARDSLVNIDIEFRADFDGQKRSQSYLYRLYRTDADRFRRESAFRAYNRIGDTLAGGLEQLIRLRNQGATKLGATNFFTLMFKHQGLDAPRYLSILNTLDSLSAPQYRDILNKAQDRLGFDRLEIWDLAYAYADANRTGDYYFPADSQFSMISRSLKALGYDLDKLPIYFDLQPRSDKSQLAYAFPIKPPYDVRVLANVTDGYQSARTLMHEIGHALHMTHISQDRALFVNGVSESWQEGMAQLVAALMDQPDWLVRYAGMPPETATAFLRAKAEQDIIYLRTTIMRLMWEYEAYQNPGQDLNKLYWDLFERYMMLPRHDDLKPWASIIHYTTHPVYVHNYLFGDMITAQSLEALLRMYATVIDNPSVGAFLNQNYFRFGARYEWRDLLERGTGERLDPQYLIRRLGIGAGVSASADGL